MPNAYLTLAELRATTVGTIKAASFANDPRMLSLLSEQSRWVDDYCHRVFYPSLETRYFHGSGLREQWVDDLISITSVSYSADDGATYTVLSSTEYFGTVAGNHNRLASYDRLELNIRSTVLGSWPCGQRSIKIVGVWGYTDDRNACWDLTGDEVENNPLAIGGAVLTVNELEGKDIYGITPRLSAGGLYRISSEYVETTLNSTADNSIGILRARNGTTAAQQAQNTAIYVWRPVEPIRQAVAIQAMRMMQRGFRGFGDSAAMPELGEMFFMKSVDPEAKSKLEPYVRRLAR